MPANTTGARCSHCGHRLSPSHQGPCPNCGKTGKTVEVAITEELNIASSLSWEKRHEYLEKRPGLSATLWTVGIAAPIVGFFAGAIPGLILGLVVAVASLIVGPFAVIKVREITRGGGTDE